MLQLNVNAVFAAFIFEIWPKELIGLFKCLNLLYTKELKMFSRFRHYIEIIFPPVYLDQLLLEDHKTCINLKIPNIACIINYSKQTH